MFFNCWKQTGAPFMPVTQFFHFILTFYQTISTFFKNIYILVLCNQQQKQHKTFNRRKFKFCKSFSFYIYTCRKTMKTELNKIIMRCTPPCFAHFFCSSWFLGKLNTQRKYNNSFKCYEAQAQIAGCSCFKISLKNEVPFYCIMMTFVRFEKNITYSWNFK